MTNRAIADYCADIGFALVVPILFIVGVGVIAIFIWLWKRRKKFDYILNTIYTPTLKTTLILSGGRLSIVSHKDYPLIQKIRLEGKLYVVIGKQAYNGMLIRGWEYVLQEWSE